MKSQHRHELKTNELAEWIANFPDWLQKNRRMIIYVCILLVVVIAYYFWFRYRSSTVAVSEKVAFTALVGQIPEAKALVVQAAAQNPPTDKAYMMLDLGTKLKNMAEQTKNAELAALALIKRAEVLRAELLYRLEPPRQEEIAKQTDEAKTSYTRAAELAASDPSLLAKARFGIGLCEEELGNFQQAREIYKQIADDPAFKSTVTAAQAKMRLQTMADYETKVAFAPAPKAAPTQPQIQVEQPAAATPPVQLFQTPANVQAAPTARDTNAYTK